MFWFRICSNHDMRQFFKNINKSKIMYEVYYGWDTKAEKWFIDLQLPGLHCCTADVYREGELKDYFPKQ